MKRKSAILLISGATIAAVVSAVAVSTHLRLSATEGQEHGNETAQEIANEILTGQPTHSEQNEKNNITNNASITTTPAGSHSESEETPEEKSRRGKVGFTTPKRKKSHANGLIEQSQCCNLRSWVQLPPGPLFSVLEIRY